MCEMNKEGSRNDAIRPRGGLARTLEGRSREELFDLARTHHWWTEPAVEDVTVPVAGGHLALTLSWMTEGGREL